MAPFQSCGALTPSHRDSACYWASLIGLPLAPDSLNLERIDYSPKMNRSSIVVFKHLATRCARSREGL